MASTMAMRIHVTAGSAARHDDAQSVTHARSSRRRHRQAPIPRSRRAGDEFDESRRDRLSMTPTENAFTSSAEPP